MADINRKKKIFLIIKKENRSNVTGFAACVYGRTLFCPLMV
jgi:hypothetical protein